MSAAVRTIDHEQIRAWAEERGGKPAAVASTHKGDDVGIIRIDFPGFSGEGSLEHISWEEFFEKFEAAELALLVQEETAGGEKSNFNKLVKRTEEEAKASSKQASKKQPASKSQPRNHG